MKPEDRIREIESFLHFALGEWPAKRARHQSELSPRCRACIVNDRAGPFIDGQCLDCRRGAPGAGAEKQDRASLRDELDGILRSSQGRGGGAYDAVVLFSGGKDSTYLLHRLKTEYPGLRMLAAMVDNSFASTVALANANRVAALLDIDLCVVKPKQSLYQKTFRHALTHLNKDGCYTTVDRMDGDLTFDIGRNLTARLAAPLLIAGLSEEQVGKILGLQSFESPHDREVLQRTHSAGFCLPDLYSFEERERYWWDGGRWPADRVARVLFPFYAWQPSEQFVRSEVVRLGLLEEGRDNPLVTNNDLIPVMLAVDVSFLGYSGFEPEFAQMVREGKADRTFWLNVFQALEYQAKNGLFLPQCIDDTLSRLGLTRAQVGLPAGTSRGPDREQASTSVRRQAEKARG